MSRTLLLFSAVALLASPALAQGPVFESGLAVGDPAPELHVAEWVKGDPVPTFEKGKVYVVEFWATWCGPCIASMPHLSKIQAKYADQGLTIIGVTSEDRSNTLDRVKKMVREKGKAMGYTVAWDDGRKTYTDWMVAAGQTGIPCSFLVDQNGKIAYIGHPVMLDLPVKECVAGTWDAEKSPAKIAALGAELNAAFAAAKESPDAALEALAELEKKAPELVESMASPRFELMLAAERFDEASKLGARIVDEAIEFRDPMKLNEIAWNIVDPEKAWAKRDLKLAARAAEKAVELTDSKDGAILDTLARVRFLEGDLDEAIRLQEVAVARAALEGGELFEAVTKVLAEYRAAKAKKEPESETGKGG